MRQPTQDPDPTNTANLTVDELVPLVYNDLCNLASRLMQGERRDHTLGATALVHEAYLRLTNQPKGSWDHRGHFFGAAATTMRCILVDHAKRRNRKKRIGGRRRISLEEDQLRVSESDEDLLALDEILTKMYATNHEMARIVELRFFAGLTIKQTAELLETSTSTIEREWRAARVWLSAKLDGQVPPSELSPN